MVNDEWIVVVLGFIVLALLYLAQALTGKPFKGIFLSFLVICLLTVVSLALATIPFCKKYGLFSLSHSCA